MKNFFKTLMIVALCGAAIGMVSCNTKQNVPIDQTQCREQLIGQWKMTYERQVTRYGEETSLNDAEWMGVTFTFNDDGKLVLCSKTGKTYEGTWSLSSEGISMQYRAGNYYNGKITKVNDTDLELELKSTEDGYDGYLNVIWRFER